MLSDKRLELRMFFKQYSNVEAFERKSPYSFSNDDPASAQGFLRLVTLGKLT